MQNFVRPTYSWEDDQFRADVMDAFNLLMYELKQIPVDTHYDFITLNGRPYIKCWRCDEETGAYRPLSAFKMDAVELIVGVGTAMLKRSRTPQLTAAGKDGARPDDTTPLVSLS